MKMKFYDFETYPNWWCVVVSDEEASYNSKPYNYQFTKEEENTIKNKMRVYTSDDGIDGIKAWLKDASNGVLTGYNSKRFDLIIQKCISLHFTPRQVYIAAQILVGKLEFPEEMQVTQQEIYKIKNYVTGWKARWAGAEANQDLMDDSVKSLKDKEASFGMDIRETTVPFGKLHLTEQDKEDIIFYCKHDVYALHVFYTCVSKPYIETKLDLAETNNISKKIAYESTNAVLVGKALGAKRVHGTTIVDPTIKIYQEPLNDYIEKWVPEDTLHHLLTSQKAKQFKLFGNKVFTADGGIHSTIVLPSTGKDVAVYAESTEYFTLVNVDLSGCHPSVMCFAGAMPRSITKPERFVASVVGRRELKKKPKKLWTPTEAKLVRGWKLQHNTTYGSAGNKHLPLYDDYMRSKVCRVSQLIVIAVSMNIYKEIPNAKILQTNTDGILVYMRREYLHKLKALIKHFEDLSNFVFEFDYDSKIWQFNVNNYIAIEEDGSPKIKGKAFKQEIWQKGTNKISPLGYHAITKAQYELYVNDMNPIEFLLKHDNVNDFAMNATKGSTYSGMVHTINGVEYSLGKVARVIAIENKAYGDVRKIKGETKALVPNCPPHALIVNDDLRNYRIEGDYNNRRIVSLDGSINELLDMNFYAGKLSTVLNKTWYKIKNDTLTKTDEFELSKFMKG